MSSLCDPTTTPIHCDLRYFFTSMHQNIFSYHALTGCDTVGQMSGHGKKSTWKVFKQHATLLNGLGYSILFSSSMRDAKQFLCKIYSPYTDETSINQIPYCTIPSKGNETAREATTYPMLYGRAHLACTPSDQCVASG